MKIIVRCDYRKKLVLNLLEKKKCTGALGRGVGPAQKPKIESYKCTLQYFPLLDK